MEKELTGKTLSEMFVKGPGIAALVPHKRTLSKIKKNKKESQKEKKFENESWPVLYLDQLASTPPSSAFSIQLSTIITTNITNPPKCLHTKFSVSKNIKHTHTRIGLTHVQMLRVSLCQANRLSKASFNGHSHR